MQAITTGSKNLANEAEVAWHCSVELIRVVQRWMWDLSLDTIDDSHRKRVFPRQGDSACGAGGARPTLFPNGTLLGIARDCVLCACVRGDSAGVQPTDKDRPMRPSDSTREGNRNPGHGSSCSSWLVLGFADWRWLVTPAFCSGLLSSSCTYWVNSAPLLSTNGLLTAQSTDLYS